MGVCTAGHLPAVTSTSYPSLTSHLLATFNAQRVGPWNVTIRMLRSVLPVGGSGGAAAHNGDAAQKTTKLMYIVQMSEFPDDTFVLVEDLQRETRASIRTRHTFAVMQAAVEAQQIAAAEAAARAAAKESDRGKDMSEGPGEQKDDMMATTTDTNAPTDGQAATTNGDAHMAVDPPPPTPPPLATVALPTEISDAFAASASKPTRHTLFVASAHYTMLLTRLNLPAPLGAPSMGDGQTMAGGGGGPGAWQARGAPVVIQGATYDLPSMAGYGYGGGAEWRVRLGMIQSGGGTRSAGAIVQNEYLPLLRVAAGDAWLTKHLHSLFPAYLTTPTAVSAGTAQGGGLVNPVPTPEQWQEVIPASNQAWLDAVGITGTAPPPFSTDSGDTLHTRITPLQQKDPLGWHGKERGRRLAYLYVTLLRNQSVI